MSYKVTAFKNVTIRANARGSVMKRVGDQNVIRMGEDAQWIELKAGEVKDGLGMVWGVRPDCVPDGVVAQTHVGELVTLGNCLDADLPKEFFGLFRLEVSPGGN